LGANYVMVISTISGLLRYVQGDIITFVTEHPYRVKVVSRIESYINAFGEDLLTTHVTDALRSTNIKHDALMSQYHVAPHYISLQSKGRHDWYIEWQKPPRDLDKYEYDLDIAIQNVNPNYKQKRVGDIALSALRITSLGHGTSQQYFSSYSRLSAQSKLQRLRNDRLIADRLEELVAGTSTTGQLDLHSIS